MAVKPAIEPTEDGSQTLIHPVLGEYYHSMRGAVGEAEHVFIANGFDHVATSPVRVLEVGFGSGLNAWLTMRRARETGRRVEYTALELYPVEMETALALDYAADEGFVALHGAPWGERVEIADGFGLHKRECDLVGTEIGGRFDLVYFDAFAPDCQPEMWSREVFEKIYRCMSPGGVLVTYSAKGDVKRALRAAGFEVSRLPGALGKRHMIRGIAP